MCLAISTSTRWPPSSTRSSAAWPSRRVTARADRSSSTSVGSRWRPGRSQAWPPHKPTEEPVYPWAMGRFMMMSDRRRLSRMVRRRDRALTPSCEVERGASALRRLVLHVGGIRSAERALGEGPKAAFMSVRLSSIRKFSVVPVHCRGAARLQLIAAKSPRPDLPSRVWAGSICFCLACRPRRWLKEGRSRLFDGRTWAVSMPGP
jgi:hypothetical protein